MSNELEIGMFDWDSDRRPNKQKNWEDYAIALERVVSELQKNNSPALTWREFDWNKIETRPTTPDRYLICRKDGKIHWEKWNGSGWAYNHNEIRFWAVITKPTSLIS